MRTPIGESTLTRIEGRDLGGRIGQPLPKSDPEFNMEYSMHGGFSRVERRIEED